MRLGLLINIIMALGACGKTRNPDRCCTSEADCAEIGLPNGSLCEDGELCRGNECIVKPCSSSGQCDVVAPYCEDSSCSEQCSDDASCPGLGQSGTHFCVAGSCVQCRDTADCGDLVCVDGSCTACATDGECASGVCITSTQVCARPEQVAWVEASGSAVSECTKTQPCTLQRALSLSPARETLKLGDGLYELSSTLQIAGTRQLTGGSSDTTRITSTGSGPVITVTAGSNVALSRLQIFGAKTGAQPGIGVRCMDAALQIDSVKIVNNASDGVDAQCALRMTDTTVKGNHGVGARLVGDANFEYMVRRSLIARNSGGINAKGRGRIENSFVVNNREFGGVANLELYPNHSGSQSTRPSIDFVTTSNGGIICHSGIDTTPIPITNVVTDIGYSIESTPTGTPSCVVGPCVARGSEPITAPGVNCTVISYLAFINEAADDFHLVTKEPPVTDSASGGSGQFDYDGELRPKGAAADLGADEAK